MSTPPQNRAMPDRIRRAIAHALAGAAALAVAPAAFAADVLPYQSIPEILKASNQADWRTPDVQDVLYLDLPAGRVVIEMAPAFAPLHVANVRALAREHYFDGLFIYRVQDNYVVQWGDPDEQHPRPIHTAKARLPAEFARASAGLAFTPLPDPDTYAAEVGFRRRIPRGPRWRRAAMPGWHIATAWWARDATRRPTAAAVRSSTP